MRKFFSFTIFIAALALLGWSVLGSSAFQACVSEGRQHYAAEQIQKDFASFLVTLKVAPACGFEFIDKYHDAIVALGTLIVAFFTFTLWRATDKLWLAGERQIEFLRISSVAQSLDTKASIAVAERSADIARDAMVAGERAFIFAQGVLTIWERSSSGEYGWRFRPQWQNSGNTPTKNLRTHIGLLISPNELPPEFKFAEYDSSEIGTGTIAPKTRVGGGLVPRPPFPALSPADVIDIQNNRKFLYMWGWASYDDVFPETAQHITRFAWLMGISNDPFRFDPSIASTHLGIQYVHCSEGNCADEECDQKGYVRP